VIYLLVPFVCQSSGSQISLANGGSSVILNSVLSDEVVRLQGTTSLYLHRNSSY